ncbi:MAG: aspartyl/asparaginyl beta-hydroxylase domain-containing protein [Sphingomonas sp.]|uniref:aspartyl/asparaginyl beta-hydroxylase domain-containing protein n=1 Tax=Sphingomonas sp. TaxID=28214 RepID=UPI00182E75C8|nr:aspartyl/asparaginyl beta-hydroxylase domain-containing protein [Sphingomonas sp.]MBA3666970.1 aspartyl/asparaginyl beta-hydroxylase domain-containing protein [Sphingomonas sp.]
MPQHGLEHHLSEAKAAQAAGRTADAGRHFLAVLALDPHHLHARNALGLSALEAGDASAAADHFRAAASANPKVATLWTNLAMAHRMSGDSEEERAALDRALAIDRIDVTALIRLAELHERMGELGSATDRWAMVLTLCEQIPDPTPELQAILGRARTFIERRHEALEIAVGAGMASLLGGANERDRRRGLAAADFMLGRRQAFANQCHGFFYPFLPADEFFDRGQFSWLERLESATAEIRAELEAILASVDPGLAPYIEMPAGTPTNLWSKLDKSADWSAFHLWRDGERIDEACARARRTAELVDSLPLARIPGRAPAVFFSILRAGKRIPPHTGVTNVRTIIHLPLIVPEGCGFRVGGETRQWREGEAFAFDDTIEHEAWNNSDSDRAMLILDCWNPHLSEDEQAMVLRLFQISENQRPDKPLRG